MIRDGEVRRRARDGHHVMAMEFDREECEWLAGLIPETDLACRDFIEAADQLARLDSEEDR